MKTVNVSFDSIQKVKSFVTDITPFDCDFDLISGRYHVDAKSIMGIFSLDFAKPIQLNVLGPDEEVEKAVKVLAPYIVE